MKERGIIMSAPMVRALLEGRKTQTRRIINWKRIHKQAGLEFPTKCKLAWFTIISGWGVDAGDGLMRAVDCPYGAVGDRLRCRINHNIVAAARITLELTGVRVERLQKISEEDARSEGMPDCREIHGRHYQTSRLHFQYLWQSLHGKGAWDKNPWVWVLEFKRV